MNKKTKLMYAAVLAASIAAPIAGFLGDSKGLSMTPASVQVPFLHGLPIGPFTSQTELASITLASTANPSPLMRRDVFAINFLTRAHTNSRKWSSNRCCARPAPLASAASR